MLKQLSLARFSNPVLELSRDVAISPFCIIDPTMQAFLLPGTFTMGSSPPAMAMAPEQGSESSNPVQAQQQSSPVSTRVAEAPAAFQSQTVSIL